MDINDLTIVLTNFGQNRHDLGAGRVHRDGTVDINDLTIVLANFGATSGERLAAVPEPSSLLLIGVGAATLAACALRRMPIVANRSVST